jgi:AhpD family alkylhydroperoxidase
MTNPATHVDGVMEALLGLSKTVSTAAAKAGVPQTTVELIGLRASQINGCAVCLDMHSRGARKAGEKDERLATLAAWRDAPYFNEAERAALALTEAGTRLADKAEPIRDELFAEVSKHYDETGIAVLVLAIATINTWNRLNVMTGQVAGDWTAQFAA